MVRRICKVGKGAQVENLLFYWFFCASVDVGRFLYLNKYASGLGSTNLCEGFFGLIFPTKRIFEPTVLLLKKAARCQPFLAVVRCLFHNHLRLKRSSLLNVYLNYKFEISLLTSHLFFSLFILMFTTSVGYRLGLLMSTTCLNCARFYDGVKLFSFKRVYIRFSNFCQLLAKSTRQNWFSRKVHFLQIYKPGESVTLCSKFQFGFDLQRLSTFLDSWGVLEDEDCF